MHCVRCSHPLPPRADRCLRCFALNPDNRPAPVPHQVSDSGPAAPVAVSIASDPPAGPLAISFDDEPAFSRTPAAAITEPEPEAAPAPALALEPECAPAALFLEAAVEPAPAPHRPPARAAAPRLAGPFARLLAFFLDAALLLAGAAACLAATLQLAHLRYPLDFVRETAPLWCALLALLGAAWSFFFVTLCGRTPGMALAGHRLRTLEGGAPHASQALARALFALPSAGLGLYGFALALFDARGQTLHDKLCRCLAVVD